MTTILNQLYSADDINLIKIDQITNNLVSDPNIHKNRDANIIINKNGSNIIEIAQMGYLTTQKQAKNKLTFNTYNARLEKIFDAKLWSQAFLKTHCLIPVSGFYAYVDNHPQAIPYQYSSEESEITYLAGFYNYDKKLKKYSFAIITCESDNQTKDTPNRFPLMVKGNVARSWLVGEPHDDIIPDYRNYNLNQQQVCRRIANENIKCLASLYHLG